MSNTIEHAREGLEQAHHALEHAGAEAEGRTARNIAILIAALAACLALAEMGEKASQNSYLTHHISLSDTYAFLQAKNIRRTTFTSSADIIESMPNLDDAARKRVEVMRAEAARMLDDPKTHEGSTQLLERAKELTEERDHAFHNYHKFETTVGALQIAIVLASVSIVARVRMLTIGATVVGGLAVLYGIGVYSGII